MTIWQPDTCDCEIEYDELINLVEIRKRCKLHSVLDGELYFEDVLKHNRSFKIKVNEGLDENIMAKEEEVKRIRNL